MWKWDHSLLNEDVKTESARRFLCFGIQVFLEALFEASALSLEQADLLLLTLISIKIIKTTIHNMVPISPA